MRQSLKNIERYPYPFSDYIRRVIWSFVRLTIWRLFWHRIPYLRMVILRLFGGKVELSSMAFGSVNILRPWDLTIGKFVALGPRVHVYNLRNISIGENTVISQDVYICGGTHNYTKSTFPLIRTDINIGSSVWICAGAFIGPGVTIGDGAVVGARAVVFKDVKPWTVVGGNPARFIKNREIKAE